MQSASVSKPRHLLVAYVWQFPASQSACFSTRTQRVVQFRHAAYRVISGGHLMCCSHAMLCQREVAQRQTREIGPRQLGVCFYHTKALVSHANSPSRQDPGRGRSGQQLSETTGPREASFHCSLGSASGMCRPLNEQVVDRNFDSYPRTRTRVEELAR